MYPLNQYPGHYSSLPADPERPYSTPTFRSRFFNGPPYLKRLESLRRRRYFRPLFTLSITIFGFCLVAFLHWLLTSNAVLWEEGVFGFSERSRPGYLDVPLQTPMRIRLAVISRVDEFARRQAHRDYMLKGIPKSDVQLDYRFFVGRSSDLSGPKGVVTRARLWKERRREKDIVVLDDLKDVAERLSEKRFMALKWTNSVPHNQYDYSITLDSDAFCRFSALARRLRHMYADLKPTEQPILIAKMGVHHVYFENTVADGNANDKDEDRAINGPWYSFPIGYAYMLSSNLTETILSVNPPLPHHVNYPSDDVIIGSWMAGLKNFHDPSIKFETLDEKSPQPVHPRPYLPYAVDTNMIDIKQGWNDFKNRGGGDGPIGWESVCVHRMKIDEMRAFRKMEEVKMEWDS